MASSPETNLRTYVRGPEGRDGVWFLSLDIGSGMQAGVLRGAVGAPYHKGHLTVERRSRSVAYAGKRAGGGPSYRLRVRPGEPIAPTELETWLTGRWRAYTVHLGQLLATPLEHEPWQLRRADLEDLRQDLTTAAGIEGLSEPVVHYADRVGQVRVGGHACCATEVVHRAPPPRAFHPQARPGHRTAASGAPRSGRETTAGGLRSCSRSRWSMPNPDGSVRPHRRCLDVAEVRYGVRVELLFSDPL